MQEYDAWETSSVTHTPACRDRIEGRLRETDEGLARLQRADDRVTEAKVRESERQMRESSRDEAERVSRQSEAPFVVRESTAESALSADDGSWPLPLQAERQAPMGRGGGSAETLLSDNDGDADDQRIEDCLLVHHGFVRALFEHSSCDAVSALRRVVR